MTDKDKLNQLKTHADAEDKRIDNLEKRIIEIEKEKKTKLKEEKEKGKWWHSIQIPVWIVIVIMLVWNFVNTRNISRSIRILDLTAPGRVRVINQIMPIQKYFSAERLKKNNLSSDSLSVFTDSSGNFILLYYFMVTDQKGDTILPFCSSYNKDTILARYYQEKHIGEPRIWKIYRPRITISNTGLTDADSIKVIISVLNDKAKVNYWYVQHIDPVKYALAPGDVRHLQTSLRIPGNVNLSGKFLFRIEIVYANYDSKHIMSTFFRIWDSMDNNWTEETSFNIPFLTRPFLLPVKDASTGMVRIDTLKNLNGYLR
jgi:hypothetical protein